jgi:N-acetylmuramoyl-L-alanine amidase
MEPRRRSEFPHYYEWIVSRGNAPCGLRWVRRLISALALVGASAPGWAAGIPPGASTCQPESFKIALDVGHTPEASGAISARGVTEYTYNRQLAKDIEKTLRDGGFGRTSLITARGVGRPQLLERVEHANALRADLLLSIHHDDVQEFYHTNWTYNGATHAFSDRFSGYSLFVSRENPRFEDSLAFAKLLGSALTRYGMRYSPHHAEPIAGEGRELIDRDVGVYRYDQLVVLKYSLAPAVLLEAGVIVNRMEELVLASPEGRGRISASILDSINHFCAERQRLEHGEN